MIKGLSLFANVGIAETYLKDVGIDICVANELLEERANFYRHLYPTCEMISGDITDKRIFNAVISASKNHNVEFVIATPPCQGMSIAGLMNPYDERNSLVKYAVDVIEILNPKYVLLENVRQQLTTPIFFEGEEMLIPEYLVKRLGHLYNFNEEMLINAADYGVPQRRRRYFIVKGYYRAGAAAAY